MKKHNFRLYYSFGVIALAVIVALLVTAAILAVLGANVLDTMYVICIYPFTSLKNLSGVVNVMTPLAIVGIGICIAYRSGFTNLGGEGQMIIGIITALLFGLNMPELPKWIALPGVMLCGMLGGAIWGAIPGILKTRFGVSELLSTVMLNYIATQLFTYCLRVPMLDPAVAGGSGDPQTVKLAESMWLSRINQIIPGLDKNMRFHTGVFIAIVLAVLVYLLMWKTSTGYSMRAAGLSRRAARYGGINVNKYAVMAVILSGACCGLAGTIEVLGIHHRGLGNISGGYGFSGIVVALFGGLHPIGVLPAAFFFAIISFGCSALQINKIPLPSNTIDVLMGIVILVIVSAQMTLKNRYLRDRVERFLGKCFGGRRKEA